MPSTWRNGRTFDQEVVMQKVLTSSHIASTRKAPLGAFLVLPDKPQSGGLLRGNRKELLAKPK